MKHHLVRFASILAVLSMTSCSDAQLPLSVATAGPTGQLDSGQAAENPLLLLSEADRPEVIGGHAAKVKEIEWDALIPDDFRPDKLLEEYQAESLDDDDPRAAELMAKLKDLWDQAPVRNDLDGALVKLPGFVVPVEADSEETTGFLLVPYYGACIHVPPPPANQTVYVLTEQGKGTKPGLFDVVSVTGTMSVKRLENDVAEAGYTLYATDVQPYE